MNANDTTLLELVTKVLDDNKAENIVTIDLKGKTSIANYMVIASGTSNRHVASLADKLKYELKQKGFPASSEGEEKANCTDRRFRRHYTHFLPGSSRIL